MTMPVRLVRIGVVMRRVGVAGDAAELRVKGRGNLG
jgi:hypothetical protein